MDSMGNISFVKLLFRVMFQNLPFSFYESPFGKKWFAHPEILSHPKKGDVVQSQVESMLVMGDDDDDDAISRTLPLRHTGSFTLPVEGPSDP